MSHGCRDRLMRQPLLIGEYQAALLSRRQNLEAALQRVLSDRGFFDWVGCAVGDQLQRQIPFVQRDYASLTAQHVDGAVAGDGNHPRERAAAYLIVLARLLPNAHEYIL